MYVNENADWKKLKLAILAYKKYSAMLLCVDTSNRSFPYSCLLNMSEQKIIVRRRIKIWNVQWDWTCTQTKKKVIKKCGKLYITKYTNVYCVLAISYTKTEPKNDQLTLINPKMSYSQHWFWTNAGIRKVLFFLLNFVKYLHSLNKYIEQISLIYNFWFDTWSLLCARIYKALNKI